MREDQKLSVSHRITRLRWQTPILAFLLVLAHQLIEHPWLIQLPPWQHFASQMLFYGLVGPALAIWVLTSLRKRALEIEEAESAHSIREIKPTSGVPGSRQPQVI